MKTIEDIRLEAEISNTILELVRDVRAGRFNEVPNGDVQAFCEALATNLIRTIREAA